MAEGPRTVEEWIADHPDQAIPTRVQERVWKRAHDRCQGPCKRPLRPRDRGQIDHVVALCNGGEHRESNLRLLCAWCHADKTKGDVTERRATLRKRKARLGLKVPTKHPVPCSRATDWAKRYDRETGYFKTVRRPKFSTGSGAHK